MQSGDRFFDLSRIAHSEDQGVPLSEDHFTSRRASLRSATSTAPRWTYCESTSSRDAAELRFLGGQRNSRIMIGDSTIPEGGTGGFAGRGGFPLSLLQGLMKADGSRRILKPSAMTLRQYSRGPTELLFRMCVETNCYPMGPTLMTRWIIPE